MVDTLYELRSLFFAPLAFFVLWTVFLIVKKIIWRRLEILFKRTQWDWDEQLLKALERPCRYLVILGALSISLRWAPPVVATHWLTGVLSKIAIVIVCGWIIDRISTVFLFHTGALSGLSSTLRNLLKVVLRMAIYSIVLLISLEAFGVSITPLLASLGVGSLAVALALQDTLGNLFSGFYLVLDRPIRVDDVIRLEDGTEGKVKGIGWRSTRIELGSGNTVILPNSKISSSRITNYEFPTPEVTFPVILTVRSSNDLERVERVTLEVAKHCQSSVHGAVQGFVPVVSFQDVTESGVKVSVTLRCERLADQAKLRHELLKATIQRFKKEKIELAAWTSVSSPPTASEAL